MRLRLPPRISPVPFTRRITFFEASDSGRKPQNSLGASDTAICYYSRNIRSFSIPLGPPTAQRKREQEAVVPRRSALAQLGAEMVFCLEGSCSIQLSYGRIGQVFRTLPRQGQARLDPSEDRERVRSRMSPALNAYQRRWLPLQPQADA